MTALCRLALDGGRPSLASSHVAAWPPLTSDDDIDVLLAMRRFVTSDRSQQTVRKLERVWSDAIGRSNVIACKSGSVAARLALAGLDLGPGDEVISAVDGFVPSISPAAESEASTVLVDLDPETLQIDPLAVSAAINDRTRAIVASDLYGTTADFRALGRIAAANGLALVEDGSHSVGAMFDHQPVGSLADIGFFSLNGDNAGPALGAGGLFVTDDERHAMSAHRAIIIDDEIGVQLFDADSALAGWSCRMSDLDAAVALGRWQRSEEAATARAVNGGRLRKGLQEIPGIWLPEVPRGATHVYSSFPILVVPDEIGLPESAAGGLRDTIVDCMTAEGLWVVPARSAHRLATTGSSPAFASEPGEFPVADGVSLAGMMLGPQRSPLNAPNTVSDMDAVVDCFAKLLRDNLDRVRQLALERRQIPLMI